MNDLNQASAQQRLDAIMKRLLVALIERTDLQSRADQLDLEIKALRDLHTGSTLGKQAEQERRADAELAAPVKQ